MNFEINKKSIFKILPILLVILAIIFIGTYALFNVNLKGEKENLIKTNQLSFTYIEPENSLSLTNVEHISDVEGKSQTDFFEFTVSTELDSGSSLNYQISLLKQATENSFNDSAIKIYLTKLNNNIETEVVAPTLISNLKNAGYINRSRLP